MNMAKGYIAQIEGFTSPAGNGATVQAWWDSLKASYSFTGKTLKFFECKFNSEAAVLTSLTPVKTLIVD